MDACTRRWRLPRGRPAPERCTRPVSPSWRSGHVAIVERPLPAPVNSGLEPASRLPAEERSRFPAGKRPFVAAALPDAAHGSIPRSTGVVYQPESYGCEHFIYFMIQQKNHIAVKRGPIEIYRSKTFQNCAFVSYFVNSGSFGSVYS